MIRRAQSYILTGPWDDVRAAFIARAQLRQGRASAAQSLIDAGLERIQAARGSIVTDDGREIVWASGEAWALRPDVHAERLASALEAARERNDAETKSVVGTESLSQMVCPKCGDSLQHTKVCPACAAGELGYRHRYTCVCGGVDLVSKEPL